MFERTMIAGWGDMDFNSHMRNTAYLDKAADLRMLFFASAGFPVAEFRRLKLGPVIRTDEITYFREVGLLEELRITLSLAGLSDDGSRWKFLNEFFRSDGELAATVTSSGGWLDLSARRLVAAPPDLLRVVDGLPRAADYEVLPTSVR